MTDLTEATSYDAGVYEIQTTDPVVGGAGGIANLAAQALANRTNWLHAQVEAIINGTTTLTGWAPLLSPALTGSPTAPDLAAGDDSSKIANSAYVQGTVNGMATVPVGGNSNVVLTNAQWGVPLIKLTGVLTGNISVIFPTQSGWWLVENATTGAFAVTCQTAAGSGIAVTQGAQNTIWCDGANILFTRTDFASVNLTGVPTAPTPVAGTSTTQIATTAFIQAALAVQPGRLLNTYVYTLVGSTYHVSVNGGAATTVGARAYTPAANMGSAEFDVTGGGGGAGGTPTQPSTTGASAGCGGAGGRAVGLFTAAQIAAALVSGSLPITLGTGGNGGSPSGSGSNGTNGGTSSAGSLITAGGGTSGSKAEPSTTTSGAQSQSGGPGTTSGGTIPVNETLALGSVGTSISTYPILGEGGQPAHGNAGITSDLNVAPTDGTNGGGGAGASISPSNSGFAGSNGGGGIIIIKEYT